MKTDVYVDFKKMCEFETNDDSGEVRFDGMDYSFLISLEGRSHEGFIKEFLPTVLEEEKNIIVTDDNTLICDDLSQIIVFGAILN